MHSYSQIPFQCLTKIKPLSNAFQKLNCLHCIPTLTLYSVCSTMLNRILSEISLGTYQNMFRCHLIYIYIYNESDLNISTIVSKYPFHKINFFIQWIYIICDQKETVNVINIIIILNFKWRYVLNWVTYNVVKTAVLMSRQVSAISR